MNNGGDISPEVMEASIRTVPMRVLGAPEDVGAAAAFLASSDAKWITGQVLAVNGGGLSIGG
jgi:3-oxoacyl-[acyl-carrier protein] reductase